MTTFGGDGKALKSAKTQPMFEESNVEDVAQSETNDGDLIAANPGGVESDKAPEGATDEEVRVMVEVLEEGGAF